MCRLTKIDHLTLDDHTHLTPEDHCFFFGEYTARKGYSFSETNSLISNFKKSITKKHLPEWRYKEHAVQRVVALFRESISDKSLKEMTLVPIPPSKAKDDLEYDDRMLRVLQMLEKGYNPTSVN